jgi:hypothetical protein
MNIKVLLAALVSCFVVSACSTEPQYTTRYTLTPPDSAQGRTCVATCQGNQQLCISNVRAEAQKCESDARQHVQDCNRNADDSYRNCVNYNTSSGSTHIGYCRAKRDTDRQTCANYRPYCNASTNCDGSYRECFKQCGGKVQANRVCYKNCENVK